MTARRVLMLSKDPALLQAAAEAPSDALVRHRYYVARLRARVPDSDVRIITLAPPGAAPLDETGLRVYGTGSRWRASYLLDVLRLVPRVLADGWRPDVVTVQTPWEEGVVGYVLARALGARFLPQLHFDLASAEWQAEHWANPLRRWTAVRLLRRADGVRVVAGSLAEALVARFGLEAARIHLAPVGVEFEAAEGDKSAFRRAIAPALEARPVVLYVGRFVRSKNLPLWLEAAAQIRRRSPDVAFVFAGDGPEMAAVQAQAQAMGLADACHFLGNVGRGRLPEVYAAADLVMLASDHEGFGRVIVEAYLAGVPVVSTACIGPRELIVEGETGALAPIGDAQALASAALGLLQDDARRQAYGRIGRERMRAAYSLEQLTERLVDCWERV